MTREELNKNILDQAKGLSLTGERLNALNRFETVGLPHKKLENYKYTNVDAFFPTSLKLAPEAPSFNETANSKLGLSFHNGYLNTDSVNLPNSVKLEVITQETHSLENFDALENLNLALKEQTILLTIEDNSSLKTPLYINHLSTESSKDSMVSTRLQIKVGKNSVVRIMEQFNSPSTEKLNRNHLGFISVSENANVEHVKVVTEGAESFHFGSLKATVAKDASFHSFTFTTGAKLSRNNIQVDLNAIGAHGEVHGLYALKGTQQCDNFSIINHHAERTESEQLFKAVLDDLSHGIFTGKIVVHRDAQLVNSSQLNKNLLLSKKAHADTRPQLEVYADDVKCAHGATVGQLNDEELFYLESRAISPKDARVMLCHGFVQEALDKIKSVEVKTYLEELLFEEFEKEIHTRMREEV